jgi:hemolysin activation/secretion protein
MTLSFLRRLAVFISIPAFAVVMPAAVPDAGALLRDQQPAAQPPRLQPSQKSKAPEPATIAAEKTLSIRVKSFAFSGHTGLAREQELQEIVAPSLDRPLGIAELQAVAASVTSFLQKKGFLLARAYLPRQDVTDGIVEIAILQAKIDGTVQIKADASRVNPRLLQIMTADIVQSGQPLNVRDLERSLLLINDLPGVSAKAILEPGSSPGTTRLVLDVKSSRPLSGAIWADNFGNRHTGTWRGNAFASYDSPLRIGDQATAFLSGSEGLAQTRLAYGLPLWARGPRGNIALSAMRYKLTGDLKSLDAKGDAYTVSAWLSHPLIRRRELNLSATLGYDFKALSDELFGFDIRDKRVHAANASLSFSANDSLLGGGYSTASLSAAAGHLDLSRVKSDERVDRLTSRTAGGFSRVNLSASRLQRIGGPVTAFAAYSGQVASGNLDSSEKMSLGGPYGVRAYPVGEASGDEAHLFSFETRYDLPLDPKWGTLQFAVFADTGRVTLNKKLWPYAVQTLTGKNEYWLSGAGATVAYGRSGRLSFRLTYAHKLGENDGRSLRGEDADGRDDDGRFWVFGQLSL